MGQINLFKIDSQKHEEFFSELGLKYGCVGEKVLNREMIGVPNTKIDLSLFLVVPENEENVEWSWLLQYFGHKDETSRSNPRGVLVIKFEEDVYACTYGFSYFVVDKFCDSDFAFNFARRVEYREIKTTSLISPGSKRNKAINTYIDYDELEFDSGESFTKLKVNLNLEEGFELFKEGIEIGRSIKFHTSEDSIGTILDILNYVENIIRSKNEIYKIPIFSKVRDKEFKKVLNNNLAKSLEDGLLKISLSELDIIGVVEVFKSPDSFYKIKFNRKNEQLSHLSSEVITGFIEECGLNLYEGLEKVKIVSYQNETETRTDLLYNLIDHIDEENNCVLTNGEWYRFNGDYLDYLNDSLREIDIVYEERFDYSSKLHEEFVKKKINAE